MRLLNFLRHNQIVGSICDSTVDIYRCEEDGEFFEVEGTLDGFERVTELTTFPTSPVDIWKLDRFNVYEYVSGRCVLKNATYHPTFETPSKPLWHKVRWEAALVEYNNVNEISKEYEEGWCGVSVTRGRFHKCWASEDEVILDIQGNLNVHEKLVELQEQTFDDQGNLGLKFHKTPVKYQECVCLIKDYGDIPEGRVLLETKDGLCVPLSKWKEFVEEETTQSRQVVRIMRMY